MRLSTLGGAAALLSLVALSSAAPGCGGGGGGGGGGCSIPGTLVPLALQGQPAPGTGPGIYAAIPASPIAHVAAGGWAAFVADVTGGTIVRGLFVARPDGSVRLAYAVGDLLPDSTPGTGTITDFERVFVTPGGVVVALVDGTVPSLGIVTARVDNTGTVVEKHGAFYVGQALPVSAAPVPGNLAAIDPDLMAVDDQGTVFFHGTGTGLSPVHGIYFAARTGPPNQGVVVATTDPLDGGGLAGTAFDGMGIDADGLVCAYSVNITGGPSLKGIFVDDGGGNLRVAENGDAPPFTGGRTFDDVFAGGPLLVSLSSGITAVAWTGDLSGITPDLGVFIRVFSSTTIGPIETIAAPGELAPLEPLGATFGDVFLLPSQQDPFRLTLQALITGGDTQTIFYSSPSAGTLNEIWREGETAPDDTATFTTTYPSFDAPFVQVPDDLGSPAFAATLSDATTGVWWAVRGCGFFTVAKSGDVAPGTGGGTFGTLVDPALVSTATNVVIFSAPIVGGTTASGLFRQG